jgi:hypothetical protein
MRAPSSTPNDVVVLVVAGMLAAIVVSLFGLFIRSAHGGELMICHLQPGDAGGWHYRTKVGGRPQQCWYQGPDMKPRRELYWAEAPMVPPLIPPIDIMAPEPEPNEFDLRWKGEQ